MGFHPLGVFCSSEAPNPEQEASHLTRTSSLGLYRFFSVPEAVFSFMVLKFLVCSSTSFQTNLADFLSSCLKGVTKFC